MSAGARATSSAADALISGLLQRIAACRICRDNPDGAPLPHEPRPVLRVSTTARILVAGQAPGVRVHATGLPFNDPSGDRLRAWMGVDRDMFYDASRFAIVPMGLCFPGLDARKADLPPRPECRRAWHDELMAAMPQIELTLVIGRYARDYHFTRAGVNDHRTLSMTQAVRLWGAGVNERPRLFLLPHPSWRNSGWLKRHPWFEAEVVPALRAQIARTLAT